MKGVLNLRTLSKDEMNESYINDLKRYDGQEVEITGEDDETYDVEMSDTSEYTVYKDEVIFK